MKLERTVYEAKAEPGTSNIVQMPSAPPVEVQADPPPDSIVEELAPWDSPVDLPGLVEEMEERMLRHLILPDHAALTIAMWVAAAYVFDSFRIFPRVVLHSPTKRCGKSTMLEVMAAMGPRTLLASNVSPAAVYRVIEKCRPTLLIDEADSFLKDNEELRGVINSSHTKAGAFVIRCQGDNSDPKKFSTWAPIVLAGINKVADTIMDRAVVIPLQRKLSTDRVERLPASLKEELIPLRRKLARWAADNGNVMRGARASTPDHGNDRAIDNWIPIFALAGKMGGEWPDRCTQAFEGLEEEQEQDPGTELLRDVQALLFEEREDPACDTGIEAGGVALSKPLLDALLAMEERPWATWGKRGSGLTFNGLSNLLGGFKVRSRDKRIGIKVQKGYPLPDLKDAFGRYLPSDSGD